MRPVRTTVFLLVCLGLLIMAIMLLRGIFTSGDSTEQASSIELVDYARDGTNVEFVTDGPIVYDQAHRAIRIVVDAQTSRIELIDGYNNSVIRQEVFANNAESYKTFLASLESAGFSSGLRDSTTTELGKCPLENRYVYRLSDNGNAVFRYWSSGCGRGTFEGETSMVQTLFRRQIPSQVYDEISREFDVDY